jgi:hypothetical protein
MTNSILSDFTSAELESLIEENPSLRGYIQGYLGELALKKQLLKIGGVTSVEKISDHHADKGDLRVIYNGRVVSVEVKSLKTTSVRPDVLNDTWQGTVLIKNTDKREIDVPGIGIINTSSLIKGEFDILAICCYAVSKKWEFLFIENRYLPEKSQLQPGVLKTSFIINPDTTALVSSDFIKVVESNLSRKAMELNV